VDQAGKALDIVQLTKQAVHMSDFVSQRRLSDMSTIDIHSPKGLLGTPVQFLINAII